MKLAPPNNTDLPELNGFMARSFWLQLLTVIAMVLNSQGIDIFAALGGMGLGGTPAEVLATGDRIVSLWQQAMPIVTGIWAYLERRAPHYRLVWPWKSGTIGGFLIILLLLALPPGAAQAQGRQCAATEQVLGMLGTKYGETAQGAGVTDGPRQMAIFANRTTGTWTVIVSGPDGLTCLLASGQGYVGPAPVVAEGDPT